MSDVQKVDIWTADWGQFIVPDDVPRKFRVNGWFDRRFKITRALRRYFEDMNLRLRDDLPIQSWAEWNAGR